ncbi:MAG: (2Fe-2S) ferredoxin domain-containing protein [Planctomycetota bacterium]|nr:(2Fe-2S) ferredoxin domain-containing protein [Planctomycetota bacterium]
MAKKIRSVEDLKAVRKQAQAQVDLRTGQKDMRITVHMGTCGIAAGGRDVLVAILECLGDAGAEKATVQQAGCAGLCDQEPMISITDKSGGVFRYGRLDKNKVRQIIDQHVVRGQPVRDYLLDL